MPKDSVVRVRVPQQLKDDAEALLTAAGISTATAVRCLLLRIVQDRRMPFDIFPPTDEQIAAARLQLEQRDRVYDPRRKRPKSCLRPQ